MQTALQKLPWDKLTPAAVAKIKTVVTGSPLFHQMPQQKIYADPEIYQFLIRHPDIIIGFWEQLGVTELSLREVRENQYILQETGGTTAAIEVLHRSDNLCIVYAKGEYRGSLLSKPYQGDVILILRTQYARDEANEPMVVCDLDTFIQINSLGVDVLVKLFFSQISKVADSNFEVAVSFVSQVSKAASRSPEIVKDAAEDITSIRQEVCTEFCDVVDRVAMRFARRKQPAPLPTARQRTQPVAVQPKGELQDFTLSSRPPAEWGLDHFFDSPQMDSLKFDSTQFDAPTHSYPLSLYESVRYEGMDELTIPKRIDSGYTGHAVPSLPRPRAEMGSVGRIIGD